MPLWKRAVAAAAGTALLACLAGVGAGVSPMDSLAGAAPEATPGGVPSYALPVGETFTWILPLETEDSYEYYQTNIEEDMWLPLYWAGKGSHTGIDYAQSIAKAPVYSDHDKAVTVTMKTNFKWSTGARVTSNDVKFFFQLIDVGKKTLGNYLPGLMPDDIASVAYPSSSTFVLHLKRAYNPVWFTGNQLTWIYPLPAQEWDRTSLTSPAGSAASTPAGAKKVFTFLFSQCKHRESYATNPLWKIVDGPFEISAYDFVTHEAQFATNRHYTGPTKPRISGYKVYTFTTGLAELDALRSGNLTFGYIPLSSLDEASYFKGHGYTIKPWVAFFSADLELSFSSKTWGPLVKQLYIRQVLQHLITEDLYIKDAMKGYGLPDYGPIADFPGSDYVSPGIRKDPYPYDPKKALELLRAHGWMKGPGGVDVCERAGTGPSKCGAGIPKGKQLSFLFMYATGTTSYVAEVSALQAAATSVGIDMKMDGQQQTTMYTIGGVCPSAPPCRWGIIGYSGYAWTYGQYDLVPVGTNEFGKGSFWSGGYTTPKAQRLIEDAETEPGLEPLYRDEDYLAKNLPDLWMPLPDNEILAVKKSLSGWQHLSPYGNYSPQTWYFTKSG